MGDGVKSSERSVANITRGFDASSPLLRKYDHAGRDPEHYLIKTRRIEPKGAMVVDEAVSPLPPGRVASPGATRSYRRNTS